MATEATPSAKDVTMATEDKPSAQKLAADSCRLRSVDDPLRTATVAEYLACNQTCRATDEWLITECIKDHMDVQAWLEMSKILGMTLVSDFQDLWDEDLLLLPIVIQRKAQKARDAMRAALAKRGASTDQDIELGAGPPYVCPCGKFHEPKQGWKRSHPMYWAFEAAKVNCLHCVQSCLAQNLVTKQDGSHHSNFTIEDWAKWGDATDVLAYLETVQPVKKEATYVLCHDTTLFEATLVEATYVCSHDTSLVDAAADLAHINI